MNDRDALFAAILANPNEDTPRLVYADYLEEHGEGEYAAFIRKQIELSKVEPWDEESIRDRYQPTLNDEVTTHPWLRGGLPDPFEIRLPFRRGFPNGTAVHFWRPNAAAWVKRLPELFGRAPIDDFAITGENRDIPQWKEFVASPHFAKVRKLTLSLADRNIVHVHQLISSPHATGLRELEMWVDSKEAAQAFFRSPLAKQLTSLTFAFHDEITAGDVKAVQSLLKKSSLQSLKVYGSPRLWAGLCAIGFGKLESFVFYDFGSNALDLFSRSLTGQRLRALELKGPLTDKDVEALVGCEGLSGLRSLTLEGCGLTARAVQALAKSPHLKNLLSLNLSHNKIGDGSGVALAKSPYLTNLLALNIRFCGVGDKTGEAILNSPLTKRLVYLDLIEPGQWFSTAMKRRLSRQFKKSVNV